MVSFWMTFGKVTLGKAAQRVAIALGLLAIAPIAVAQSASPWPDGTYAYGGSDRRDEIGTGYVVLEVRSGSALGVVYYPRSEYSCVFGEAGARELALTVVDPYDRSEHPYAIDVRAETVAGTGATLGLEGYHPLGDPTAAEREMLDVCKADHPNALPE